MTMDTDEVLGQIEANGYAVIPDMIDTDKLKQVRTAFSAATETMKQRGLVVFDPRLDPNPHNIRVNNLPDMDPVFMELLRHPDALRIARAILGERAIVSNFSANVALPGAGSMNLHSDQALIGPSPWNDPWLINIIWCLDDVRADNGGTLYLPESHRLRAREEVPSDSQDRLRAFSAPAGAVIAMEGRLWHTSGVNVTEDESRALLFALYSRDFVRQQMNWEALLSDQTKKRLSEEDRELLGMGPLSNVHGVDLVMREGYDLASAEVL